jgi:DNA-binding CsgD family transcriptional regulator
MFNCAIYLLAVGAPPHWEERLRLAEECPRWPRRGVSGQTLGQALLYCGLVQLAQGERAQAEALGRQIEELAERTHFAILRLFVAEHRAVLAIVDGRLEEALALLPRFEELADESGAPIRGRQFGVNMMIAPALYLGRADIWLSAFDQYGEPASLARRGRPAMYFIRAAARAMCLVQLGRLEEARTLLQPVLDDVEGNNEDERRIAELVMLLQAAVILEHKAAAQALASRLASVAHLTGETGVHTCVARHLGDAAALAGDRTAAHAYYLQALKAAGKIRFRPELALTRLRLAELFLDVGDQAEALEHLKVGIPELREMKMQPALGRGLSLLERVEHQIQAPVDAVVSHVLTGREREVARLVAAGHSNREIADMLVITEGTVEVHVKHILNKLGFRSRAQVAAWAATESL